MTIVEKWNNIGFLEGISNEHKIIMANYFEKLYKHFTRGLTKKYKVNNSLETISFPILRKILVSSDFKIKIEIPEFLNSITKIRNSNEFKTTLMWISSINDADVEAEMCNYIVEMYIEQINL